MIRCALVGAVCLSIGATLGASAGPQSREQLSQQRTDQKDNDLKRAKARAAQQLLQRPASEKDCTAEPNEAIVFDLDSYGNPETLVGTADAPVYVYGKHGLKLHWTATDPVKSFRFRIVKPGPAVATSVADKTGEVVFASSAILAFQSGNLAASLDAFHSVKEKTPGHFPSENDRRIRVARDGRTLRVSATKPEPASDPLFALDLLRAFERGGHVKLQIEEFLRYKDSGEKDTDGKPIPVKDVNGDPVEETAVVATILIIPYSPWTVVLDEKGAVDPRFRSAAPAFVPCPTAIFLYSPIDPRTAPSVVRLQPAFNTSPKPPPFVITLKTPFEAPWAETPGTSTTLETVAIDEEVHMAAEVRGRAVGVVSLTREIPPGLPTLRGIEAEDRDNAGRNATTYLVHLDRTGVVTWQYLNRRRPPRLDFSTTQAFLKFQNNSPDREFIITFSGLPETERAALLLANVRVTNCREGKCQGSVHVGANGDAREIPLVPLRNAFVKGVMGSVVSFQLAFFDDDATPTFSRGYFSFVEAQFLAESPSATSWSAAASITGQRDPDLSPLVPKGQKSPAVTFATPWTGDNRSHVNGSATLGLKQTLGSRADAEIELSLKKGDFGADASGVQPTKYFGSVYAIFNATLTGGRFDLVAPTSGIALAESGEAVSITAPLAGTWLGKLSGKMLVGVAQIFRKEISDGSFTADEEQKVIAAGGAFLEKNHTATLLQLREIRLHERLRTSFYYLDGSARRGRTIVTDGTTTPPRREIVPYEIAYRTWGTDASFTYRHTFISGGLYRSERVSDAPALIRIPTDDAAGNVGLISATYTEPDGKIVNGKRGVDWVVTGTAAAGGPYVGETQGFAPDLLFLSTFAPALKEPGVTVGPGLTNKMYFGATWMTPRFDFIKRLARKVKFPVSEINTSTLTLRLHHYRLRGASDGNQHLGTEANVEFRLESPKGVRYTLTLAGLRPGAALTRTADQKRLIDGFQFAARFGISVRFD